jgi:drug/metabolite transporter (DMT)-like permease
MSMIVPIFLAVWLWDEQITGYQVVGIVVALLGLSLLTRGSARTQRTRGLQAMAIVVLVFGAEGMSQSCIRWVHHAGLDDRMMDVLFVVGLTAGTLGMGFVALQRYRPAPAELLMGAGIGLFNVVALLVILVTLSDRSAAVYFPVVGCTVVILDGLFAHFFWKERLSSLAWLGAGLVVVAMVIVLAKGL